MILKINIIRGIFFEQGKILKLLEKDSYYNKYSFISSNNDNFLIYVNNSIGIEDNSLVNVKGTLKLPSKQRNSGGFDYSKYMYSQNYYGSIFIENKEDIEILEIGEGSLISKIQKSIITVLSKFFPEKHLGVLLGMTIGDTFYVSEEVEEYFRLSGITHLLAVSGSNVTYIITVTKYIFEKIFGKNLSNFISIIMIILFVLISGASPSVVRAGIMASILIFAEILAKAPNTFSTITTTAFIMLLFNPLIICDVGFILSFGGTIGIVLFNNTIVDYFNLKFSFFSNNKLFKYFIEIISVSLSAQIVLLPVMWHFFNTISIVSLLTNVLVGPFVGIITVLGIITYFLGILYLPFGKLVSYSVYILISILILISKCCSKIPYGNITIPTPNFLIILIYYLSIVFISHKIKSQNKFQINNSYLKIVKTIISILIIIQTIISIYPKEYIEIDFIDVGQGDSTLIKTSKGNVLIDGGGSENSDYDVGDKVLVPYLLDNTNGCIDILFISHFHEDHAEGCISVLERLKVKKIVIGLQAKQSELYTKVLKLAKEKNIPIITLVSNDIISLGDVSFKVLFPSEEIMIDDDLNNNSLVIRLDYYNTSMLFTGDIEKEAEKLLINNNKTIDNTLDVDILKVAHHGSNTSTVKEFIKVVTPKISLIGVGENNKFGHPTDDVLKRLEDSNSLIFRTDRDGEISIILNKNGAVRIKKCIN